MDTWRGKGYLVHSEDPRYKQAKDALDRATAKSKGKLRSAISEILTNPKNQHWVSDKIYDESDRVYYIYQKTMEVLKDKYGYSKDPIRYGDFRPFLDEMAKEVGKPVASNRYTNGFKKL